MFLPPKLMIHIQPGETFCRGKVSRLMHKRVSMAAQEQLGTLLDLTIRQRPSPIGK